VLLVWLSSRVLLYLFMGDPLIPHNSSGILIHLSFPLTRSSARECQVGRRDEPSSKGTCMQSKRMPSFILLHIHGNG
jgi:hypothetical protein